MRKPYQSYDLEIPNDFKMAAVMERDRLNFESPNIWFYVGADCRNLNFAKVGITMNDLKSRSYSSANPNYYLFCAFQCQQSTTKEQLKRIEHSALNYLDDVFRYDSGLTKRACHFESQYLSECYYDVDFEDFFVRLHDYLLDNHKRYFQTTSLDEEGFEDSYALAWQFNPRLSLNAKMSWIRKILRW
ncbi:hypothetical protein [Pectobacterium aroidearum]|uniref:hypothetical protein n=1 Tax=Pectobacterium aroidearum TaxID=1201031 RepID=UPI0032EED3AF